MADSKTIEALEKAVGDTAYGQYIIEDAKKADPDEKYGQNIVDRLHEMIGVLAAYERIHKAAGQDAKATTEADKIAIAKKALAAIQ